MMIENEPVTDKIEKGIRFGCGGLFGFALAAVGFLHGEFPENIKGSVILFIGFILFFGLMAMFKGDKFWHKIKEDLE